MATAIDTSTVAANAAFRQEIKEVNSDLWQLLENVRDLSGSEPAVREHAAQLVDMLVELRDQLALHFALEEAFGYFEEPAMVALSWTHEATVLRSEHRQLFARMTELLDDAESLLFEGNLADFVTQIPTQFREFDDLFRQHESFENEMVMRQFDDVGVGD